MYTVATQKPSGYKPEVWSNPPSKRRPSPPCSQKPTTKWRSTSPSGVAQRLGALHNQPVRPGSVPALLRRWHLLHGGRV